MAQIQIELLKPYGMHVKGARLTVDRPIADLLIQRDRAKAVTEKSESTAAPVRQVTGKRHASR